MKDITEMLKGILEGCILEILQSGQSYGYEITQTLRELGFDHVMEGTVYTILVRFEREGMVVSEKKQSDAGPSRKYYRLSETGVKERHRFWKKWRFIKKRVNRLKEIK